MDGATYPIDFFSTGAIDSAVLAPSETLSAVRGMLSRHRLAYIKNFSASPDKYCSFLRQFGDLMPNFSSRSKIEDDRIHPEINMVKYKPREDGAAASVHHAGGSLRVQSTRCWYINRPKYFAMLMINPGWNEEMPGHCGESVIVSWRDFFERLFAQDGEVFCRHFEALRQTSIAFEADNVREEISESPLIYDLVSSRGDWDLGVRLKHDLDQKIERYRHLIPAFGTYKAALSYLVEEANTPRMQISWKMKAGDLIIIDNDRYAHGRRSMISVKEVNGAMRTNPRELWSVTVI